MKEKAYNNKQLKKIVNRALELQKKQQGRAPGAMDMDEILAVGQELGISRELMVQAAEELDQKGTGFWGGKIESNQSLRIPRALSRTELEDIATIIDQNIDREGTVQISESRLSWKSKTPIMDSDDWKVEIQGEIKDSETVIQVSGKNASLAGGLFGGLTGGLGGGVGFGVGFGVGMGALGSLLFSFGFAGLSLGLSFLLSRSLFSYITAKRQSKLDKVIEKIDEVYK
jgi:hypothetical protein